MLYLRNFTIEDADILIKNERKNISKDEMINQILQWDTKSYQGHYFEMFAVVNDDNIVGTVSIFEKSKNIVSIGPEIFNSFKRQGFGKFAVLECIKIAKNKGYLLSMQQVREDNIESIALHNSLGFETDGYIYHNKKGDNVLIYMKIL